MLVLGRVSPLCLFLWSVFYPWKTPLAGEDELSLENKQNIMDPGSTYSPPTCLFNRPLRFLFMISQLIVSLEHLGWFFWAQHLLGMNVMSQISNKHHQWKAWWTPWLFNTSLKETFREGTLHTATSNKKYTPEDYHDIGKSPFSTGNNVQMVDFPLSC